MVELTIKKGVQNKILKTFKGTKKEKGVKSAVTIAEMFGIPRRQVMTVLMQEGLVMYSASNFK